MSRRALPAAVAVRSPTKNQLANERIKAGERMNVADQRYATIRMGIRYGFLAVSAYFLMRTAEALAGKTTIAIIEAALNLSADRYFAYAVAALCAGGFVLERRQRKRAIKETSEYIRKLETHIDPKRSRSRLTETGEPRKEDLDDA
jgi:hypothetical protein